jgi:hypothetical protein
MQKVRNGAGQLKNIGYLLGLLIQTPVDARDEVLENIRELAKIEYITAIDTRANDAIIYP